MAMRPSSSSIATPHRAPRGRGRSCVLRASARRHGYGLAQPSRGGQKSLQPRPFHPRKQRSLALRLNRHSVWLASKSKTEAEHGKRGLCHLGGSYGGGVGKPGKGSLSNTRPTRLAHVLKEVAARGKVDPSLVETWFAGCVTAVGEQGSEHRAHLRADGRVPGGDLRHDDDRMCGSSQQPSTRAANAIRRRGVTSPSARASS